MAEIRRGVRQRTAEEMATSLEGSEEEAGLRERMLQQSALLRNLDDAIAAAARGIGQCPPVPRTLRGRLGALVIRCLSRLAWWQQDQIRLCVSAVVRRNRDQAAHAAQFEQEVIGSLATIRQALGKLGRQVCETRAEVVGGITQVRTFQGEAEGRLSDIESAQIRLQSAQLGVVTTDEIKSLEQRIQQLEDRFHTELNGAQQRLMALKVKPKVTEACERDTALVDNLAARFGGLEDAVAALEVRVQQLADALAAEKKAHEEPAAAAGSL